MRGKIKKDYWIVKFSGLFDPVYYLKQYPDVRHADVDPLEHFVMHGWKEGRNPNVWFDTKYYLESNPDVAKAGVNPFVHWIVFGRFEGRDPKIDLNLKVDRFLKIWKKFRDLKKKKTYTELKEDFLIWTNDEKRYLKCKVCESFDKKSSILKIKNPFPYSKFLTLYRCDKCGSYFYHPFRDPPYESDYGYEKYWKFYVEQGAGIDFMIKPIIMIENLDEYSSFLDVGCSFGWTLHFVEKYLGLDAFGCEPGAYGRLGSQILGLKIYNDYIQNVAEFKGRFFDIVYSSEVIEHISSPYEFLKMLYSILSENGVLVLTTPNAKFIDKKTRMSTLLGILSAGFHCIIYSPESIKYILKKIGFYEVFVVEELHRLLVFASKSRKLSIIYPEIRENFYIPYLRKTFDSLIQKDYVYDGIGWRLFKELVNRGEYEEAMEVYLKLKNSLIEKYGEKIEDPSTMAQLIGGILSFDDLGSVAPYFLPNLYYYIGIIYLNHISDYRKSSEFFRASFDIMLKCLSLALAYYEEAADLLWRAKFHEGLSYKYLKNTEKAKKIFEYIISSKPSEYLNIEPPEDIIKRVKNEIAQSD